MAIFKTDIMLTGISGKIGGQSLSKQTQYNTIRNISQPAKDPSPLQSTQRFITAAISAEWRTLTAGQKAAWVTTAVNYTYKDPFGNTITRTPFGAFRYVGQNLWLNGLKPLRDPPIYIDVVKPIITIDSSSATELIISATGATTDYFYPLFVQINLNPGQKGIGRQQRHIANLSSSQLTSGVDILPIIQNYFKQPLNSDFLSFAVDTVSIAGGNRAPSLEIITLDYVEGPISIFDPDYQAILDKGIAEGFTLPPLGEREKQNQLMINIKAAISLTRFDMLYVLAQTGSKEFSWINWANPNKFLQNGTWKGPTVDGSQPRDTGGLQFVSNYTPSIDAVQFKTDDCSYGYKIGNLLGAWAASDFCFVSISTPANIAQTNGTLLRAIICDLTNDGLANKSTAGGIDAIRAYSVVNRPNINQKQLIKDGTAYALVNRASTGLPDIPITFGAHSGGFATYFAVIHLGSSLTLAETIALNTAYDIYLDSL